MQTHSVQVILTRRGAPPALLFELPWMEDGEFVIKGRKRLVMLRKRRANVPVQVGECVTIMGAKYNLSTRQIMVPGSRAWCDADRVQAWNSVDPSEYIAYCDAKGAACAWHT